MRKNRGKSNLFAWLFLSPYFLTILCLALLAFVILPVYRDTAQRRQVDKEIWDLQKEIERLESGNRDLKKMMTYLESDQFAEKEARLGLGLKKKDEEVVVVREVDESEKQNIAALDGDTGDIGSNFLKWFNYFFRRK